MSGEVVYSHNCMVCNNNWHDSNRVAQCINCATYVASDLNAEETGGKKFDTGKPRVGLLPGRALEEVAAILTFGAEKYGDHNWREGMTWSRIYDAILRHVVAFIRGEDKDPESGRSHIAHAACGTLFLLEYILEGIGKDDRYKRGE